MHKLHKQLLIVSMGRSGTSFVSSWLHGSGLNMGENLKPAGIGNELGFFEDVTISELQGSILKKNKKKWNAIRRNDEIKVSQDCSHQISLIIDERQNGTWGFKDPSTALLLDMWRDKLPDSYYLILYRPYTQVVDSMMRWWIKEQKTRRNCILGYYNYYRYKNSYEKTNLPNIYLETWVTYYERIFQHIEKLNVDNFKVSSVENLLSSPYNINHWLQEKLLTTTKIEPKEFFNPQLFHSFIDREYHFEPKLKSLADEIMYKLKCISSK